MRYAGRRKRLVAVKKIKLPATLSLKAYMPFRVIMALLFSIKLLHIPERAKTHPIQAMTITMTGGNKNAQTQIKIPSTHAPAKAGDGNGMVGEDKRGHHWLRIKEGGGSTTTAGVCVILFTSSIEHSNWRFMPAD